MNGAKYYRIIKGLSLRQVSRDLGLCYQTLVKVEAVQGEEDVGGIYPEVYIKLRNYYHVPIDDLLRNDFPARSQRHKPIGSTAENVGNLITIYRRRNDLTLRDMGEMLGICHETVRKICMMENAPVEYLCILAARSGLSIEDFGKEYGG